MCFWEASLPEYKAFLLIIPSVFDYILAGLGELVDNLVIIWRWVNGAQAGGFS